MDVSGGWKLKVGPSFPSAVQTKQVRGPRGRGMGGAPAPSLTSSPAHSHAAEPGILWSQKVERGFQRFFPVMGPVLNPYPRLSARTCEAGGRVEQEQRRLRQEQAGTTQISGPAQVRAQAGISGFTLARSPPAGGWPSAQQAQKTDLSTCPS